MTSLIFILSEGITRLPILEGEVSHVEIPAQAPPLESQLWEVLTPPCDVLLSRRFFQMASLQVMEDFNREPKLLKSMELI